MSEKFRGEQEAKLEGKDIKPTSLEIPNDGYLVPEEEMEKFLSDNGAEKKELTAGKSLVRFKDESVAVIESGIDYYSHNTPDVKVWARGYQAPREYWEEAPVSLDRNDTVAQFYRNEQSDRLDSGNFKVYHYSETNPKTAHLPGVSYYTGGGEHARVANGWNAQHGWNPDSVSVSVEGDGDSLKVVVRLNGALTKEDVDANREEIKKDIINMWKTARFDGAQYSSRDMAEQVMNSDWEIVEPTKK